VSRSASIDLQAAREALHAAAQRGGRPTYRDPVSGLQVLTAGFLRAQGACCRRGCRHCPYPGNGLCPPPGPGRSLSN
jgi:nucleoside-diphosphate-sugar epimerase